MADFLTRLASRTLGLAPVAVPRIASLFESMEPVPSADDGEPPLASAPGLTGASPVPAQPRARPRAALPPPLSAVTPDHGAALSLTTAPARSPLPAWQPRPRRAEAAAGVTEPETEENTVSVYQRPLAPAKVADARVGDRTTNAPSAGAAARRDDGLAKDASLPRDRAAAAATPDDDPLLPSTPRRAQSGLGPASARQAGRRGAAGPVDQRGDGVPPAPPHEAPATIEITIGRVEVRAVHAPPPDARPAPVERATPPLSLEQYLRGQQRGAR